MEGGREGGREWGRGGGGEKGVREIEGEGERGGRIEREGGRER